MQRSIGELAAKTDRLIADVKSQGDKIDRVRLTLAWVAGGAAVIGTIIGAGIAIAVNVARDTRRSSLISNGTTTVKFDRKPRPSFHQALCSLTSVAGFSWAPARPRAPRVAHPRSGAELLARYIDLVFYVSCHDRYRSEGSRQSPVERRFSNRRSYRAVSCFA